MLCPNRHQRSNKTACCLMLVTGLALFQPAAQAMVAGVPEPPRPGPLPTVWVGWNNDSLGGSIGKDMDDFRTNAINAGVRHKRVVVAVDYSMLTDYRTSWSSKQRSDELTGSIGYEVVPDGTDCVGGDTWLVVGGGARLHGDLGGEYLQNHVHDLAGFKRVRQKYAAEEGVEGLAFVTGRWQWTNDQAADLPVIGAMDAHRAGFAIAGSMMTSTEGTLEGKLGVSLVVVGIDAAASVGVFQEWHTGHSFTRPARAVAEHESGTWLEVNTSAGGWYFNLGYNIDDRAGMGTIGWMWGRPPGRIGKGNDGVMEGIVGFYQGYAYGFQYRWHAKWLDEMSSGNGSLIVDYRCGQHPEQSWRGNSIVVRQPLVGVDWALRNTRDGFSCVPFVYAGVGLREERVVNSGTNPRFPNQKNVSGVAQGGVGLRMFFGSRPSPDNPARYGLSLVYDGWLPFRSAEAVNATGTDSATYQKPGAGFGLRLAASVLW